MSQMKTIDLSTATATTTANADDLSADAPIEVSSTIKKDSQFDDILAGAFSGTVSRMITAPLDVLKIRAQLHFNGKTPSMMSSLRSIVKEEGVFALWNGNLSATYLWITYGK
jgi:Mitochondrial carrier protein